MQMGIVNALLVKQQLLREQDWEPKANISTHYVAVVSEEIRRICSGFDMRVAFRTA